MKTNRTERNKPHQTGIFKCKYNKRKKNLKTITKHEVLCVPVLEDKDGKYIRKNGWLWNCYCIDMCISSLLIYETYLFENLTIFYKWRQMFSSLEVLQFLWYRYGYGGSKNGGLRAKAECVLGFTWYVRLRRYSDSYNCSHLYIWFRVGKWPHRWQL